MKNNPISIHNASEFVHEVLYNFSHLPADVEITKINFDVSEETFTFVLNVMDESRVIAIYLENILEENFERAAHYQTELQRRNIKIILE